MAQTTIPKVVTRDAGDARWPQIGRVTRGFEGIAWLGDSLTANGSNPASNVGSLAAASAVGATSLSVTTPYTSAAGYTSAAPTTAAAYVIDHGTANEEWVIVSAVAGADPSWTFTVPALTKAHAAGAEIRSAARQWGALSVPMWTHVLSGGKLRFRGVYAHGGYTAQQIRTVYLPQVIAAKPAVCVVTCGTNPGPYDITDIANYTIPTWKDLLAAGIVVVAVLVPPRVTSSGTSSYVIARYNARLAYEAQRLGIPVYNAYGKLVEPGTGVAAIGSYVTKLTSDDVHPSELGARSWAQGLVDLLSGQGVLRPSDTFMLGANYSAGDSSGGLPISNNNALMLTDTNADGVPDNWAVGGSSAGDTFTLTTVAGINGKALTINRVNGGTSDTIVTGPAFVAVPQHRYRVKFKLSTSGLDAAYEALRSTTGSGGGNTVSTALGFDIRVTTSPAADTDAVFSIKQWKLDMPLHTMVAEWVHPAGLSTNTLTVRITCRGSASIPAYSVTIGEYYVEDLTALGVS